MYGRYTNGKSVTIYKHNAMHHPLFCEKGTTHKILQEKQEAVTFLHITYALRVRISAAYLCYP